ncbi:hypothetical protein NL533_30600, partial [Klebsiella pneumoniae]|nr:hypothetical protein [Klebsiella pneumoniae]
VGPTERAVGYAAAAGHRALQRLAFEEAAAWFDQATALDPPSDDAVELLLGAAVGYLGAGRNRLALDRYGAAAARAEQVGRPPLVGRAALGF